MLDVPTRTIGVLQYTVLQSRQLFLLKWAFPRILLYRYDIIRIVLLQHRISQKVVVM